jgi:hypothetical protein
MAQHFGVTKAAIQSRAAHLGLKKRPDSPWTPALDDQLRSLYGDKTAQECAVIMGLRVHQIAHRVEKLGLKKTKEWIRAHCKAQQARNTPEQLASRFQVGLVPWNKGLHFDSGGRSVETRFKPGQKPHTWNPIGHTRYTKDGYLQRKVTDTGITRRDYVFVHHLIWRMHDRVIPPGHILVFRDKDKTNLDINNFECITRRQNIARNTVHNKYPPEVARLVQLRGALTRQINKRNRKTTAQETA